MSTPANMVWETTSGTGTPYTLTTVSRSFNDAFGTGGTGTFYFFMYNRDVTGEWMLAKGHLSSATVLVLDSVVEGSNGTSEVVWSAGTKDVTNDFPADFQNPYGAANLNFFGTSSDVNAAVQAAITAGYDKVFLPAGWTYKPPSWGSDPTNYDYIPAGLTVIGEDRATSIVASQATTTKYLLAAKNVRLVNVSIQSKWSYDNVPPISTDLAIPVGYYSNHRDADDIITVYPTGGAAISHGDLTVSATTYTDTNAFALRNDGDGGSFYTQTVDASQGIGYDCATAASSGTGDFGVVIRNGIQNPSQVHIGLQLFEYGTASGGRGLYLSRQDGSTTPLLATIDAGPTAVTSDQITLVSGYQTSGAFLNIYQATSAYAGNAIFMNLGDGAGSFTGNFLRLDKAGTTLATIDSTGLVSSVGLSSTGDVTIYGSSTSNQNKGLLSVISDSHSTTAGDVGGAKFGICAGTESNWTSNPASGDDVALYTYIGSNASRNRIWGFNSVVDVNTALDATAWGGEIGLANYSTEVSDPESTLHKLGLTIVAAGSAKSSAGLVIQSNQTDGSAWFYHGLYVTRSVTNGLWFRQVAGDTANAFATAAVHDDSNSAVSLLVDGGSHTWGINLDGGTYSSDAILIPNNTGLRAQNAAASATIQLIALDSSDNISIGTGIGSNFTIFQGKIAPVTTNTYDNGSSSNFWANTYSTNLYLGSGGFLDWNAGEITITHATGFLNFSGAALSLVTGTRTSSAAPIYMSQTWNNVATTFNTIIADITDTASAATSQLMDLKVGGSSKFAIDKTGDVTTGTLSGATGLPISTGVSGLGTGVATFLGTPSSANLISAVTDETGTGSLVFSTSPSLTTPNIGTPSAGTLTNCTGLPISTGVSGLGTGVATFLATPSSANLATALTDEVGSSKVMFGNDWAGWTPTVGAVTGSFTSGTLAYARYILIGGTYYFTFVYQVVTNGTAAGGLTFTLPSTPGYAYTASGRDTTNGVSYVCDISGSSSTATLKRYDGTWPSVDGTYYVVSGFYN